MVSLKSVVSQDHFLFNNPQKRRLKTFLALFGLIVASLTTIIFLKNPKVAEAEWPPTAQEWLKRKQLTLVNNSGQTLSANTTYSITLNTKELYESNDISANCEDLRVYYQPNDNTAEKLAYFVEVPAGLTCATSEGTTIHFPLQADLANGSQSGNYYLYFKNSAAQSESSIAAFDIGSKKATFYCGFKGGTKCVNQSGSVSPSTESGAIRYGGEKSALSFDGANDYVLINELGSLGTMEYTIELWFKVPDTNSTRKEILERDGNKMDFFVQGNAVYYHQWRHTVPQQVVPLSGDLTAAGITANTWHHVAITRKGTDSKIFLDGSLKQQKEAADFIGLTGNYYLGWYNTTNNAPIVIDELRLSNIARYTANFTPQTTPFVRDEFTKLLLHFDENGDDPRNAGKAIDDSGNNNHGTITGAKYVGGLVGVDNSSTTTGYQPSQSYASHQGIFLEEATTNLVTNPSFEHSTYDTNWSIGTGATASQNTIAPYYKFGAKSLKLVASADTDVTTSIDPNSTNVHYLYAYVYNATSGAIGGTIDNSVAQIIWEGIAQTGTSYTDVGGGWWRIKYSANTTDSNNSYGIKILGGKTVYIDGFQLSRNKINHVDHVILDSYTDGSFGTGYSWSGAAHESASTRGDTDLRYSATNNVTPSSGSISFWVKPDQYLHTNSEFRILQIGGSTGYQNGSLEFLQGGGPWNTRFQIRNNSGTGYSISKPGIYAAGIWRHIVMVWNENDIRFYSDGASQGTPIASATTPTSWYSNQIIFGPNFLTGYTFSDFRIFDSALSSAEVTNLYYAGLGSHQIQTGFTERYTDGEPPTAFWHLNEGAGSNIYDSIDSHHGVLGTGDSAPSWASGSNCVSQNCLSFDGANDYASIADTINGLKSLSFWVKPIATTTSILDLNGSQTVTLSNNVLSANNFSSPSIYVNGQAATSLNANSWSHVLITSNTSFAASSLKLGRVGGNFFSGYIDEIKVFPYVLSADQIKKELNLGKAVSFGEKPETAPITPLASKLVAYWKFDEGYGTTINDSGNGTNTITNSFGTGSSAPTWTNDGKFNKALSFGGNDYVNAGNKPNFSTMSQLTVTGWFKRTGTGEIISKFWMGDQGYGSSLYRIYISGTTLIFRFTTKGGTWGQEVNALQSISTNTWYHFAATYDGSYQTIYLNGIKGQQKTQTGTMTNPSSNHYIGALQDNSGSTTNYFSGMIDEIKIYNYALSEDEIKLDYNQGMAAVMGQSAGNTGSSAPAGSAAQEYCVPGDASPCAPPVAEWNFEEGTGTTVNDTSGNGNTGTWYGTGTHWVTGKIGKAGKFNGSNDYIPITINVPETEYTYEAWFKTTDPAGTILAAVNPVNPTAGYHDRQFGISQTGKFCHRVYLEETYCSTNTYNDNKWHFGVVTVGSGGGKLYVDGVRVGTGAKTGSDAIYQTGIVVGYHNYSPWGAFDGLIDQIRIYNYARTPAQIAWDYNRGGPVGHWRFDECEGTVAHDVSGNNLNGAINIGATAPQTAVGTCASVDVSYAWYNGREGKLNSAMSFDGADDYAAVGNTGRTDIATLSFWAKPASATQKIIELSASDSVEISSGAVAVTGFGTEKVYVDGVETSSFADTNWHHITVVGSAGLTANAMNIGKVGTNYYSGLIDDVRIYNYALTDEQIKMLYNDGAVRFGE